MSAAVEPMSRVTRALLLAACLLPAIAASAQETPALVGDHVDHLLLEKSSGTLFSDAGAMQSRITQLAWGPGPDPGTEYLYHSSNVQGVRRMEYDATTGTLSDLVSVLPTRRGNGIAFRLDALGRWEMYVVDAYTSANAAAAGLGRLWRYVDVDGDGSFVGAGDASAPIVRGVPIGGHEFGQIQLLGDSLYVGCGSRTQNGAVQGSDAFGESAFGGVVAFIDDLDLVSTTTDAAGFPAYLADPTLSDYADVIDGTTSGAADPFTSTAPDRLRIHSAGLRNPFGLAIDRFSQIWVTNNFHRVTNASYDRSVVDASADGDSFDGPSNDDVHDQILVAVPFGDYGYRNGNWQDDATARGAGFFAGISDPTRILPTHVFDNLDQDGASGPDLDSVDPAYDAFHDPANPVGLGPHSAVTGLDFAPPHWRARYRDDAFVARFNGDFDLMAVHGLRYRDLVRVDHTTGEVERVVEELAGPTDVLQDSAGNLLIASYFGNVWRLSSAPVTVPALDARAGLALMALLATLSGVAWRRVRQDARHG